MVSGRFGVLNRLGAADPVLEFSPSSNRGPPARVVSGIPVPRFGFSPRRWERLTHEEAAPDRMKRSVLSRLMPACFGVAGMTAAWGVGRRQRYDVIPVLGPFPLALFGWAAQRARPAALVTTFYGVELRWVKTAMPFFRGFLKWAARRSDQVVAISSYTADEVRELVQVPIEVIPYTTSLPAPTSVPHAGRRSAGAPFTVLFVGRLVERKGVSLLVDAVSLLLPLPGADVRLVIVGDGPERARIEARIREKRLDGRVAVRGKVSDAELQAAYAAADAFVLPAVVDRRGDTEGLGVVLLEAMNHRVPVIASAIGGITDIVEDGVSGLLVPPGDATALAAALGRLARAPDLAAGLGEAGYRRLRERVDWGANTRRWLGVYTAARARGLGLRGPPPPS